MFPINFEVLDLLFFFLSFFFLSFFLSFFFSSKLKLNTIGDDKEILRSFYESLTSKGQLNWNFEDDLCDLVGVVCESGRVVELYDLF